MKAEKEESKNAMHQLNGALRANAFVKARTRESILRGDRQAQIIEKEAGRLLPRKEAVSAFCTLLANLKTRLIALPAAVALEANPLEPAVAQEAMSRGIREVLISFNADEIMRILDSLE